MNTRPVNRALRLFTSSDTFLKASHGVLQSLKNFCTLLLVNEKGNPRSTQQGGVHIVQRLTVSSMGRRVQ